MPDSSGQTRTCAHEHPGGRGLDSQKVVDLVRNQTFQFPLTPRNEGGEEDIEMGLGGLEDITAEELEAPLQNFTRRTISERLTRSRSHDR